MFFTIDYVFVFNGDMKSLIVFVLIQTIIVYVSYSYKYVFKLKLNYNIVSN